MREPWPNCYCKGPGPLAASLPAAAPAPGIGAVVLASPDLRCTGGSSCAGDQICDTKFVGAPIWRNPDDDNNGGGGSDRNVRTKSIIANNGTAASTTATTTANHNTPHMPPRCPTHEAHRPANGDETLCERAVDTQERLSRHTPCAQTPGRGARRWPWLCRARRRPRGGCGGCQRPPPCGVRQQHAPPIGATQAATAGSCGLA